MIKQNKVVIGHIFTMIKIMALSHQSFLLLNFSQSHKMETQKYEKYLYEREEIISNKLKNQ